MSCLVFYNFISDKVFSIQLLYSMLKMINKYKNPIEWAQFLYELEDASEHLTKLVEELQECESPSEEDFAIQLGHIYAHLNRAWNSRTQSEAECESQRESNSQFPKDLTPVG